MRKRIAINWFIVITLCLLIKIFSFFPYAVERYYTNGLYPFIAHTQRFLFGWIPFSIGDVFYFIAGIYLIVKIYRFSRAIARRQVTRRLLLHSLKQVSFVCLIIYVVFNVLWGLNYNRVSMAEQLNLPVKRYSTENLRSMMQVLVGKLNAYHFSARAYRPGLNHKRTLFAEAVNSYSTIVNEYPDMAYRFSSIKPSLFSYAGNYMGFTGYYNPFSGEAQANTTVPAFIQPFTTCHEIGHQLGYAKENEANFAGFLAARASSNPAFQYSVYFDMYSYAIRELYRRDSLLVKGIKEQLSPSVVLDLENIREFYRRYDNPIEPVIRTLYGTYLRANEQPKGLLSYNEVVAMLIAYFKRYGDI
jgi:hypothetical protein